MQKTNFQVVLVTTLVVIVILVTYFVATGSNGNTIQYLDKRLDQLINSFQNIKTKDDVIHEVDNAVRGDAPGITMFKHMAINITGVTNMKVLERLFVKHADRVDLICGGFTRLGSKGDGGWNVCQANNYSLKKPCLVYSFGISTNWSFDNQVAKDYECIVRAFDPSIKLPNHTHGDKFPIEFYNLGLGGADFVNEKNWTIRKFSTLYNELENGKKPVVDFLKIDIEGSEYLSIIEMEKDGMLKYIKQIGFESHIKKFGSARGLELLQVLERNGFKKWSAHVNIRHYKESYVNRWMMLSCCYEFAYINTNFINKNTIKYLSIVAPYGYNAFD